MVTIPTLQELRANIQSDLETQYGKSLPAFGKNFLRALSIVLAGILKLFYITLGKIQKNVFPDTADSEAIGGTLERFGRIKLGRDPYPAVAAQYTIQVNGTIGAIIPALTVFKSDDTSANPGMLYQLDTDKTIASGPDTIIVRALEAGLDSQLSIGDTMTATAPIALVDSSAAVTIETVQPLAAEDLEAYRQKILDSFRLEPEGGAGTDYRLWSADAQGVQQVYPYAKTGAENEINLFVESVIADSIDGKGTPSPAMLANVESVVEFNPDTTLDLNERGRRPLGVFQVHYLPINPKNIDIVIPGFVSLTTDKQTAIVNSITEMTNTIRPFVSSSDLLQNKNDTISTNGIIAAIISSAPGSVFSAIALSVNGAPVSSYQFINGDIPFLNSVTFP